MPCLWAKVCSQSFPLLPPRTTDALGAYVLESKPSILNPPNSPDPKSQTPIPNPHNFPKPVDLPNSGLLLSETRVPNCWALWTLSVNPFQRSISKLGSPWALTSRAEKPTPSCPRYEPRFLEGSGLRCSFHIPRV